jgi:hypothetical protein
MSSIHKLINKIYLNNIILKFPRLLQNKLKKKFNIYFIPTILNRLPNFNHPIIFNLTYQKKLLKKFHLINQQTSLMTCPYLIQILSILPFKKIINFLDIGGENIDFYLELKKKFKVRYYIFNQKEVLEKLQKIKIKNNLKDFNIIFNISDIYRNKYEFVNLGSSIQYFNNYEEIVENIIKVSKKYIFFSGIHFYNSKKKNLRKFLVVKQVNLLPTILYCYFFNRKSFLKIFLKKKYSIIFEKKNVTDNINYKNFVNLFNYSQYTDILLSK